MIFPSCTPPFPTRPFLSTAGRGSWPPCLPPPPTWSGSYAAQWNARRGVVTAEVVTAVPLDEALVRALEQAILTTTGLTAELSEKNDPDVMGGVLLKMGGQTYDGTVRGRLQALRRTLKGETRS